MRSLSVSTREGLPAIFVAGFPGWPNPSTHTKKPRMWHDMNRFLLVAVACVASVQHASAQPIPASPASPRIESLIARMTLEEKVGQLVQYTGRFDSPGAPVLSEAQRTLIRQGAVGSFLNVDGSAVRDAQTLAVKKSRLGIPLVFGLDVIHGYRTTFPIPLATAATWDPSLVERCERAAATEAALMGIHWTFAPMVDIARDPRWGRIAEGSGEDVYLGSVMAAARVRGFQGSDLTNKTALAACAKHFAAYGAAEGGRDYNTVDISERTLREVYLETFRAAVNAGATSLMCSFNEISGVPNSANRWLLTDVLRGEWKFDGMVVSDWNSIGELVDHGIAADSVEAAILGINAGVDMDMEANAYAFTLAKSVRDGRVSLAVIDEAVRRVLRLKERLGLFEDPYHGLDEAAAKKLINSPEQRALAREAARQSIVLLKNSGVLPVASSVKRIAVLGPLADDKRNPLGPWDQKGDPKDVVTVLEGLKAQIPSTVTITSALGCTILDTVPHDIAAAATLAQDADLSIIVVGESSNMSGEAASRSFIGLPGRQEELIKTVHETGKPYVVVLMNGRSLAIPWIAEHAPAIVEAWFLGVESGNAITDVLLGKCNPSGKLPVTFPRTTGQVPLTYDHKNTGRPGNDNANFTSRYLDVVSTPQYPFGFGLSYTTFGYSDLILDQHSIGASDTLHVSVRVRNTGLRAGEEIVQLYFKDDVASVTRPVRQLRRFEKCTLAPNEERVIRFFLTAEDLRFWDSGSRWKVEPGSFHVYVGPNSAEGLSHVFEYR